ncbi:MAG: cell division protein ZipA C-terminal FtsZ-binding domain-containing protein [Francisella sp.]
MKLILILVLILVLLITIDIYRKSLRIKQKEFLKKIEDNAQEVLVQTKKSEYSPNIENVQRDYPLLKDGFLLIYFEASKPIQVKDLSKFLRYYGIKYTDEKAFQKINSKDVIFSILPDNQEQEFVNDTDGSINRIIAVMNYKKLASIGYDVKVCYELMLDLLYSLVESFDGILMNEHQIRLTKKDKQNYLSAILS